jgi:DMSO reductase anchor subunit
MHPAFSVIFFTVISGCGFGMLLLVAVIVIANPQLLGYAMTAALLLPGFIMAAAGLSSSMLHLGQPQRAWRAFSQWRSSWLSREAVAAVAALGATTLLAAQLLTHPDAWMARACAGAVAALCTVCVVCTAQIYATLKTVPAWHNAFVLPGYLLFALYGGGVCLWTFGTMLGAGPIVPTLPLVVGALAVASALHKIYYWRIIDRPRAQPSAASATGLGRFGSVRSVEAPHTEANYLTREMGFVLARKHARRLRWISLMLIGVIPAILAPLAWLARLPTLDVACASTAAVSAICGLFVERWLFFAEAQHVVMLYYAPAHAQRA